jgi:hypothetical protein
MALHHDGRVGHAPAVLQRLRSSRLPPRVTILVALALAAAGIVAAITEDAPSSCEDLRRRLAEIQSGLPDIGLELVSPEDLAALEATLPEQHRLIREIRSRGCD